MTITPVVLNLTDMEVVCLQDAIIARRDLLSTVVHGDYPHQPSDNPERLAALEHLATLINRF
jgi:hypothetical protein